jgi:hypothetical protein
MQIVDTPNDTKWQQAATKAARSQATTKVHDLGHLVKLRSQAQSNYAIRATSLRRQAEGSGAYEQIDETNARRVGLDTVAH